MSEFSSSPVPLRVCSFESRRKTEMASLLERHGAVPFVAPSMREVPLDENPAAFQFADALLVGKINIVIFLTGVGTRALFETLQSRHEFAALREALALTQVVVRGPKPVAVLREYVVRIDHRAPEPNTWREVLHVLDVDEVALAGRTVAVQEYGRPSTELYDELTRRGARVVPVPVYRWTLPEDTGPLEAAIRRTIAGDFDVLMFTSTNQLTNVLAVAGRMSVRDEWLAAANRCVIASIGPTASETLREEGLPPDLEPEHPRMGQLVQETCAKGRELLAEKTRLRRG